MAGVRSVLVVVSYQVDRAPIVGDWRISGSGAVGGRSVGVCPRRVGVTTSSSSSISVKSLTSTTKSTWLSDETSIRARSRERSRVFSTKVCHRVETALGNT